MNLNITSDQAEQCKELFDSYMECMDRKSELDGEVKALKERLADICECSKGDAGKIFKLMETLYDGGDDTFGDISDMVRQIKANGGGDDE